MSFWICWYASSPSAEFGVVVPRFDLPKDKVNYAVIIDLEAENVCELHRPLR